MLVLMIDLMTEVEINIEPLLQEANQVEIKLLIKVDIQDFSQILDIMDTQVELILMKVGKRLPDIIPILERKNLLSSSVFVARAGLEGEKIVTDLNTIQDVGAKTGYLSIILVDTERKNKA